jgi:hypothetical protein
MPLRPPAGFISANYDPLKNPDAPTGVSATAGDTQASVSFTAPANVGGSAITAYYAVSNPSQVTVSGTSSPITVTGLSNGTSYTFQVWALNSFGPGPFSAASGSVTPATPVVALFANGYISGGSATTNVNYLVLTTAGNATSFGSLLTSGGSSCGAVSSSTRAVFAVGSGNVLEYATFATTGSFADFGDLTINHTPYSCGMSSSTRGVFGGGQPSGLTNVLDYITIASTGNAIDFGDGPVAFGYSGGCASTTRGVYAGGLTGAGFSFTAAINYITIATTGNATSFGNLNFSQSWPTASCSNSTRGVFAGGFNDGAGNSSINNIDYITIATTGNATDFGDLTSNRSMMGAASSSTRGFFAGGGSTNGSYLNIIEYITFASTGNAADFGDLTSARSYISGCSNAHGGL